MHHSPRALARSIRTLLPLAALCAGTGLIPAPARAVDYNFTNLTNATVSWNDGANWTTFPVDDATFPNAISDFANVSGDFTQAATTINLNTGITLGRLDIGDTTVAGTLLLQSGTGTNTITFNNGGSGAQLNPVGAGTGLVTISAGLVLNDNLIVTKSLTKGLTLSGGINLNGNTLTFQGAGAGDPSLTQVTTAGVTGTGSVVINVSGTAASNGPVVNFTTAASTYSGGTTLTAGVLVIGASSVGAPNAPTSGAIGTGTLTINGGTLRQTAATNRTIFNSVLANADFNLGQGHTGVTSGLTMAGNLTLSGAGSTRTITVSQSGTQTQANNHTISGVIDDGAGTFGLTKAGASPLVLSGPNTFEGVTTVAQGNLILAGNAPVSAAGTLGNASSAVTLGTAANAAGILTGAAVTIARDIATGGTGALTLGGNSNSNSSFTGTITLDQNFTLTSVATGGNVTSFTGPINITSGSRTLTKAGAGVVELTNTSGHADTAIGLGTLRLSNAGAFGSGAITFTNTTAATAATLQLGAGGLDLSKNLTIAGGSTGATELGASNAAATTATYSGAITLAKGVLLSNATANATTRFTGIIGGGFGVTVNGPGIVEFNGAAANTYTGLTTVPSGTLFLNSSFANGAVIGDGNTATPDLLINGGTVLFGQNNQLAANSTIQFTGGTLNLGGFTQTIFDLDYTGGAILNASGLTISNGTDLFLFDGTVIAAPTVLGRKLIYAGSTTIGTVSGSLALDADPTHELAINDGAAAVDTEISGVISNDSTASTVIKRGNGVLKLSSGTGNTFGGVGQTVTIEAGALAVTADNQLGAAANSLTFTGGSLRFDTAFATARTLNVTASGGGIETPTGVTVTIGNASQIAGAGNLTKTGAGTLVLSGDNSASWTSGAALLNSGVLSISAENQLGAATNDVTFQGGTLRVTTGFTTDAGKVFTLGASGGTLEVAAGQTLIVPGTGGLTGNTVLNKTGDGSLVVTGANATLAAGAGTNVAAGILELQNAGSFGTTTKAALTLSGGTLTLRNDTATAFNNPVLVSANSTVTADRLTSGAGVIHTLGTLSIAAQTLSSTVGANQTGTTGGVTFGASTLTGVANFQPGANTALTLGAITAAPGTGFTKTGAGTLVIGTATTAVDAAAAFAANGGLLRMNSITALGNSGATLTLNSGGTLGLGSTAYVSNPLVFAGGTAASIGGDRAWNGRPDTAPSVTFTADTVFNLVDPTVVTPTSTAIDFGAADTGLPTSTVPVAITVNADPSNITGGTPPLKKVRFAYRDTLGSTNQNGSVTGTLTINNAAIAQIRSETSAGGTTTNALGAGVEFRLNTGVNLTTPLNAGKLELIGNDNNNYGNNVVLLGDSTIGVATLGATAKTLSLNNLTMGAHTLAVMDVNTSLHSLAFAGTTTLNGDAAFVLNRPLILATITDGAGAFGVTKSGPNTLTINGGSYDGATTLTAGALALGASDILGNTAPVLVSAGTLGFGANSDTIGTLTVNGGSLTGSGGTLTTTGVTLATTTAHTIGQILAGTGGLAKSNSANVTLGAANTYAGDTSISGGTLTLGVNSALPATTNVTVTAGTLAAATTTQSFGTLGISGTGGFSSGATGQFTTTGVNLASSTNITVNAVLAGTGGLAKSGAGALNLAATNTFSGGTAISLGAVTLSAVNALPGAINLTGGSLVLGINDALSTTNDVTVTSALLDINSRTTSLGNVTLLGQGNVSNLGLVTRQNGAQVNITGTLTINGDLSSLGTHVTLNSGGTASSVVTANRVVIQGATSAPASGAIFVGGNSNAGIFNVGSGGLELTNNAGGDYNAVFVSGGAGAARFNLGGNVTFTGSADATRVGITGSASSNVEMDLGALSRTFAIGDGGADVDVFVGVRTNGAGGIIKTGDGTLEIRDPGSAHLYTGATDVNGGHLLVSGALSGSSAVNVAAGATLGGTGSVANAVNVSGTLAPGASAGTLDVGTLGLGATSTLALELNGLTAGDTATSYDQVNVTSATTGAISLTGGAQISLSLSGFAPTGTEVFYVLTRADSGPGSEFTTLFAGAPEGGLVNIGGGFTGQITYLADWLGTDAGSSLFGGNDVAIYNVIPEPGSAVSLLGGLASLLGLQRFRRRR